MRTKALLTVAAMALGALLPAATVTATSNAAVQPALSPMATAPAAATAVAATTTSRMVAVLARNEAGQMILYRGNGKGGWITPYLQIGSGWGAFLKILGPGDFSGDGRVDVLATNADGKMFLYRGNGKGGWLSPYPQIGSGWGNFTNIIGPGDFSGDGKVDVLATTADGKLLLYRGNGKGGWSTPYVDLGGGWGSFTAVLGPGDFNGDGRVDVLARDTDGRLWLYRGNGNGGFSWPRVQVGSGWGGFTALVTPGDFSGDGKVDVLARDADGKLWLYRGTGTGGWSSGRVDVGSGWNGLDPILGPGDFNGDGGIAAPVDCSKVACVALTFDDGPDAPTNRLVDTLINTRTPATFFVIGNKISARASVTLKQHRNGFPVENHTWSHPDLTTLSLSGQRSQVTRADDAIAAAGVPRSTLLRPPYGSWNSNTRQLGKPLILWSVDPRDWDGRTASQIRSHVVSNARAGSIVLMHDRVSATADAVPGIISDLRAKGFTLVTVETLVPGMGPGDIVYSRGNVVKSSTAVSERNGMLVAPDGRVVGPALVDEAPFK